jgi:DNA transformation protein and related proteins
MDADGIRELFEPCGTVQLKRMFGGRGIYLGGRIIALEFDGMIWLKTDAATRPAFEEANSRPFTYEKKSGEVGVMSYWLLPEAALDDADVMRDWVKLAEGASERAELAKLAEAPRAPARKFVAKR